VARALRLDGDLKKFARRIFLCRTRAIARQKPEAKMIAAIIQINVFLIALKKRRSVVIRR